MFERVKAPPCKEGGNLKVWAELAQHNIKMQGKQAECLNVPQWMHLCQVCTTLQGRWETEGLR
jgi:hypothetical protein